MAPDAEEKYMADAPSDNENDFEIVEISDLSRPQELRSFGVLTEVITDTDDLGDLDRNYELDTIRIEAINEDQARLIRGLLEALEGLKLEPSEIMIGKELSPGQRWFRMVERWIRKMQV